MTAKIKYALLSALVAVAAILIAVLLRRQDWADALKRAVVLGRAGAELQRAEQDQQRAKETYRDLAHKRGEIEAQIQQIKDAAEAAKSEAQSASTDTVRSDLERRGYK
jgi:Tfp pilus assembly protein PilN